MIWILFLVGDAIGCAIGALPLVWLTAVLTANGVIPQAWSYGTSFGVLVLICLVGAPFMFLKGAVEEILK